jgi:hypothetical protein
MRAEPWAIKWYVATVDAADLAAPREPGEKPLKLGQELWRVPLSIGPFRPDHNHWASWHFDHDRGMGDGVKDAILASTAPVMKEVLLELEQWLDSEAKAPADFPSGIPLFQQRVKELKKLWAAQP